MIILILTLYLSYTNANSNLNHPTSVYQFQSKIYITDLITDKISVVENEKSKEFATIAGCGPSSIIYYKNEFVITCYKQNRLVYLDEKGNFLREFDFKKINPELNGPNDLEIVPGYGLFFTTSGEFSNEASLSGELNLIKEDGTFETLAKNLHYPNGLTFVPPKTIYLAEQLKRRIIKIDLDTKKKRVKRRSTLIIFPAHYGSALMQGPNKIQYHAQDQSLNITYYGAGKIAKINMDGKLLSEIKTETNFPTDLVIQEKSIFTSEVINPNEKTTLGKLTNYKLP